LNVPSLHRTPPAATRARYSACVNPDAQGAVRSQDERTLVHSLAQPHQWLKQLLSGEVSSPRMIAVAVRKSERYVSKLMRVAFLASDLVEALLEGRVTSRLTLADLTDQLPWDWNEQRRRFTVVFGAKGSSPHPKSGVLESFGR